MSERSRFVFLAVGFVFAGLAGFPAFAQSYNEILVVSPDTAAQGASLTVTFTLDTDMPPAPPAGLLPDSVALGDMAGNSVAHPDQYTITAVFSIPGSEALGTKDAAITFTTPNGTLIFSKTAAFTVTESQGGGSTNQPFPGLNLFAPLNSTNTYLMDNQSNIVHTWSSNYRPGNSVYLLEDGTLLRTANTGGTNFNTGGAGGRIERFNWEGQLLWAYDLNGPDYRLHHDIEPLASGNILMIAWERIDEADALAAGRDPSLLSDGALWPDVIIELAPTGSYGGDIVWVWRVWDHLIQDFDDTKPNYGVVSNHPGRIDLNHALNESADWNHINAIDYNENLDQIVLSVRQFSEVWVIDHGTTPAEAAGSTGGRYGKGGELLYRWGNPQTYRAGTDAEQQLFVQHDAQWIPDGYPGAGRLLVFNNGGGRTNGNWSSVDEIVTPIDGAGAYSNTAPFAPPAPTWTYAATPPSSFYAMNISGAQRLPNGHTLICDGPTGLFFEVTGDGEIVWSYALDSAVFRVTRYATNYSGLAVLYPAPSEAGIGTYPVVDTGQTGTYNTATSIAAPAPGAAFAGQDSQYTGLAPAYSIGLDGLTVYDHRTGLTWTRSPDLNGDSVINASDKLTHAAALLYPNTLNATNFGGYSDWRLPSIKELYSLMHFDGRDISGNAPANPQPFIDTGAFVFGYGDTNAGERAIDAQFATTTLYVDTVMSGQQAMFGLNLADGRIKGYPTVGKTYYAYFVRGDDRYGLNRFADAGNGTVLDLATSLQWQQADSGIGMTWSNALLYAEQLDLGGYRDWRLPNAKELQSILDYTRGPGITGTAAIDPVFLCTPITNEAGAADFPWYWTSTTHLNYSFNPGSYAVYICFGRALGYMNGSWQDVHGAGCQRSDPKGGSLSDWTYVPNGYYSSQAPQGDAIRIFNFVRAVRGGAEPPVADTDGDGISDWTEYNYDTNTTALSAGGDLDGDGASNADELAAGTSPVDANSIFGIEEIAGGLTWSSILGKSYRIETCTNLLTGAFTTLADALTAEPPRNVHVWTNAPGDASAMIYRIAVE